MAHTSEGVTEAVEAVRFSFMTDEDVQKLSVVKITNHNLLDNLERPVPGGLYDPAFGPFDERSLCKSCGQRAFNCPGHCGHISLVSTVYNPLLFNIMHNLLRKTCFFCQRLVVGPHMVEKCVSRLKLITEGNVTKAKVVGSDFPYNNAAVEYLGAKHLNEDKWTSLQFTEAMSVLNGIPNPSNKAKCKYCNADVAKVKKTQFGWLSMDAMDSKKIRSNVLRNMNMKESSADGLSVSEGETVDDSSPQKGDTDANEQQNSVKSGKRKGGNALSDYIKQKKTISEGSLLPFEVKGILKLLWENEAQFFSLVGDINGRGVGSKADYSVFFIETVLVPPIKFRPPSKGGDSVMEHPHTVLLSKLVQANSALRSAVVDLSAALEDESETKKSEDEKYKRIISRWKELQQSLNVTFDSKTSSAKNSSPGICQLLEKKEGLFRQKMMGKRVNFACRSVISPDPYLAVNEIGIPPYFALRLTYPERVTPWNVGKLREAIVNGPDVHPGATHYVDKSSTVKLPPTRKSRISIARKLPSSRGVVVENGKTVNYESEGKIVYRHLKDGDIVLVNRQPTLHKPSIMAHVVRVLKGEKTIRMHYANCSTYNADFDGDEMNVHFLQDEISRAEAYNILNANNQYVKPTSGEPIRALIQDHVVSAVLLSKKDTFLTRDEFNQLLFSTGLSSRGSGTSSTKLANKVLIPDFESEIQSLQPAIWKPHPLWTGKQVITALLNHITRGFAPFSVEKGGKIPRDFFSCDTAEEEQSRKREANKDGQDEEKGSSKRSKAKDGKSKRGSAKTGDQIGLKFKEESNEDKLLIYKNNFVRGILDKAQFGDYGLVHTVHELYGSNTAGLLLSALSRLFTVFLQMHGFTCGVDDLLIVESKDADRKKLLDKCEEIGEEVHRGFVGVKDQKIDPFSLQRRIEKTVYNDGEAALASLDRRMISRLNDITSKSEELKGLLSKGLHKPPSKNCISLMTTSGAKGGVVNFQQISSHLGQQELEGKRVPRMVSGKTLPCFPPWDWASRSGGLIVDRFLSGLRPQEFYFHCMAGREGLVDTAVKTSRSGYLQRCLIKNLESLKVNYDYTVRDSDGSIVQFHYGEDGVDVHQTSFLENFEALKTNEEMIRTKCYREFETSNPYIKELPSALKTKAVKFLNKFSSKKHQNENDKADFLKLVEHKYISSLAQPGEPVGVLAAQSVGEPSTQMTLNTFHLAGRGEMNVTLGIPRLQEILMTAAVNIKTPFMTCPLKQGSTEQDAEGIVRQLMLISVADNIKKIKVSVEPYAFHNERSCRIYKLEMKCYRPHEDPLSANISSKEWEKALTRGFVRAIEDAIEYQIKFIKRTSGIENVTGSQSESAANEDSPSNGSQLEEDDDDGERADFSEELGSDAQKQKRQGTDEMEYDEDSDGEANEENDNDVVDDNDDKTSKDGEDGLAEDRSDDGNLSDSEPTKEEIKPKTKSKNKMMEVKLKNKDRRILVTAKKFNFSIHFAFPTEEPHLLLGQIAQKTAAKVYIRTPGKTTSCQQITCKESQVIYHGNDPKSREEIPLDVKEKIPALQASGVDFITLSDFDDVLDVRYIYSNNIHAVLKTFGVEAARETIIREVTNVFKSYGISVNIRHLSLIADFMTHAGGYRPMNRLGGIAASTSPLGRMTFETASKFIVEAAYHRETDELDTPSSRICLGLPAKVGTGCFDLMHKAEI